ncbi:hypothetical protein D6D54_07450 [Spiroplasma poulsonii]|uniref:Uncharacterized protein n=1 Tax=Spiroplasma poulsonii TaxID=2138 RepID=A0A433ENJ4_9MOLU|nr:hypothetical protein [Spiroplasma poulsonii]MBW3059317.1 hypothetical protein [Spiroplasma poulsonii]RUP75867.1 hypothetical protein D6D54_07450 [Spiroplasma poulsonii]
MPQVKKIKNNLLEDENITKSDIGNFVSFKGTKIKKNINYQNILPPMTCDVKLVQKFRNLAKDKQWTNTTLMNNILRDYFDRLENSKNEDD